MVSTIGPSTIHTIATASAVRYPFQRKGFYARGYHFAFYVRANKLYWQRSTDGITWDGENDITPAGEVPGDGGEFCVWLDRHEEPAHHPHIVYADEDTDSPLYYRRGTIDVNGDLTWDQNGGDPTLWITVVSESLGRSYRYPTICVDDTSGRPIVGYLEYYRGTPASSVPWVRASDALDGTWNLVNTKQISTTTDASWVTVVVPYQGVYIMALYTRHPSQLIKYDIYNFTGNNWAGEQSAGVLIGADSAKWSVTSQRAVKVPSVRRVHVAYCDPNNRLQYISIDDVAPVTGPVLIYDSNLAMGPAISTRIFGGDVNPYRTLYVFWTPTSDQPTQDVVAYAKSIDDGANWTNEAGGVGPQDWVDETSGELAGTNIASVYFEEQHHVSLPEGYIGLLYTTEGASPEFIRFASLEFADPDEDLLCKFEAQASAELFGKFEAQASAELLGKFVVGQDSAELLGKFEAQAIAELLGRFEAQAIVELLGRFEAQATAELLGKFEGQATVELPCGFRLSTDHWIVQGVSVEAYIRLQVVV